jgi:hypothetical protein
VLGEVQGSKSQYFGLKNNNIMIILNRHGRVIYPINFERLSDPLVKLLIVRKAYKGYVYWNTLQDVDSDFYTFIDFKNMDLWKIKFSFQIYLERICKTKRLGFAVKNKTLLKYYFKTL